MRVDLAVEGSLFVKRNVQSVSGPFDQDFTWPGDPFFALRKDLSS